MYRLERERRYETRGKSEVSEHSISGHEDQVRDSVESVHE